MEILSLLAYFKNNIGRARRRLRRERKETMKSSSAKSVKLP
jgi:hypothetical protein